MKFLMAVAACMLAACSSPAAPTDLPPGVMSPPSVAVMGTPSGSNGGGSTLPPTTVPAAILVPSCIVSPERERQARIMLRILTNAITRGTSLDFLLEEIGRQPGSIGPRHLHGTLHYGPASGAVQQLEGLVVNEALRFSSEQEAGWALWQAAGNLAITAAIYVNGIQVSGCPARIGKITGRIDLTH